MVVKEKTLIPISFSELLKVTSFYSAFPGSAFPIFASRVGACTVAIMECNVWAYYLVS
jgi:hypothetical protein